ncbi:MAG TPA: PSD1 and planctomycete cytochrome C domain-containing protein, partial [Bryobacteraceae bacterium]|nr:PSD1 and planctomycete cytochrome C domain-containing protein [Bryobacteraceae bacterium]
MKSVILVLVATGLVAQEPDTEFFEKRIRPLFAQKCQGCHGDKVKMGGLSLSSTSGIADALNAGFITKSEPEKSRLYRALLYADTVKMPPTGKLPPDEIAAVRTWIEAGAKFPQSAPSLATGQSGLSAGDRQHWAFQPIREHQPPPVKNTSWPKTPIDRFILAKLEANQIPPPSPAEKHTLLRRVTYDLTGLPPTTEELDRFIEDRSPDAFAKVVDRLLASPRYGERWGRHWLDVARYADSTGMDEDNLYPHAWRYRDYVIDSFNRDTPFDRFIKEQLAGDLLKTNDPKERQRNVVATGFLAIGPKPLAQQDRLQMIYDVVDEQIDTTTKTFLGLTVACARCHDHKFDPIPTKDYYGLASIFASTTSFRNQGRPGSISYMHYTPLDDAEYNRYQSHRWRALSKQIEMEDALSEDSNRENSLARQKISGALIAAWEVRNQQKTLEKASAAHSVEYSFIERWLKWIDSRDEKARAGYLKPWVEATDKTIDAVAQRYHETYVKTAEKWDERLEKWRTRFAKDALQDRDIPARPTFDPTDDPFFAAVTFDGGPMELTDSDRVHLLRQEWKQLQDTMPEKPALASAVCDGPSIDQHVFVRGSLHAHGEAVSKHFPSVIAGDDPPAIKQGSGRMELAEWLANPTNPLPARVMVNRIWQWHFGEALVRTPNNWGKTGEAPTHPELLDYLATQFIDSGWSIKSMHRLILLSNTYQMNSKPSKEARENDPGNRLFSRFNRIRMSVEQIRDTLLALDSSLDTTMGGSLFPTGKGKRERIDADELKRRTIYIPVR